MAATFKNSDGSLMTRNNIIDYVKNVEEENRLMIAANQPIFGQVSYDRAADTVLKKT